MVDDDREFREEFRDLFDDYNIIEAGDGQKALDLLKKANEIDLVILDVRMPGLHGTDVLRKIKEKAPGLGIVILTGYSSEDIAIDALKGGADDYIQKPIDIASTQQVIQRLLKAKEIEETSASGDLAGKIERVKRFAQRNYHKRVCLKDAAELVCLSPKYLSRIFKENTGVEFSKYAAKIKTGQARRLLKETGDTISRISESLGYQNIESFTRVFKQNTGFTPTEYRNKAAPRKKIKL